MGRYFHGDIEGKFWFGVQRSDAPSRFGVTEELVYVFCEDDIPSIEEEIKNIKATLGDNKEKLDAFFKERQYYNDNDLIKAGFKENEIHNLLVEYADLELGERILNCVKEKGSCEIFCEL